MKPTWFVIAGLILLLAIVSTLWLPEKEARSTVASTDVVTEQVAEPVTGFAPTEAETGAEPRDDDIAEFARRLIHVPDTRVIRAENAPNTDERDVTAENIESLLEANLEHGLTGDMASSYFVTRTRQTCDRFASTPEELENTISRINRRVRRAQARGDDVPSAAEFDQPWSFTDDLEANRSHLVRWYGACERVRNIFTPDLRERLEMLALSGDVMARYLYATWPAA